MCLAELALPPRLVGVGIEERADRIDIDGTLPVVVLHQQEYTVARPDVPIHSARHDRFAGWPIKVLEEMHRTDFRRTQPVRSLPTVAARGIIRIEVARSRRICPWRAVVKVEHLLVKHMRRRHWSEDRVNIAHGCGFEFRARQNYPITEWKYQAHALGVKKEEQLILLNWAT